MDVTLDLVDKMKQTLRYSHAGGTLDTPSVFQHKFNDFFRPTNSKAETLLFARAPSESRHGMLRKVALLKRMKTEIRVVQV